MTKLYTKLLEVQKEVKAVKRDSVNPFYNSKYFDINALLSEVKPILTANGLVLNQPFETDGQGRTVLVTTIVDSETGEAIRSSMYLPEVADAQKLGSAITYVRRYALQSLLSLEAEDDDANTASGNSGLSDTRFTPKVPYKPKSAGKGQDKPFENLEYTSEEDKTRGDESTKRSIVMIAGVLAKKEGKELKTAQDYQDFISEKLDLDLSPEFYGPILTGLKKLHDGKTK